MAHITRFGSKTGEYFELDVYSDGLAFLDGYRHSHDGIMLDFVYYCEVVGWYMEEK